MFIREGGNDTKLETTLIIPQIGLYPSLFPFSRSRVFRVSVLTNLTVVAILSVNAHEIATVFRSHVEYLVAASVVLSIFTALGINGVTPVEERTIREWLRVQDVAFILILAVSFPSIGLNRIDFLLVTTVIVLLGMSMYTLYARPSRQAKLVDFLAHRSIDTREGLPSMARRFYIHGYWKLKSYPNVVLGVLSFSAFLIALHPDGLDSPVVAFSALTLSLLLFHLPELDRHG